MYQKIITIVLFMGLLIWNPYPFQVLELKTFDWFIMNTEPVQNDNIVIVDLDEEFIKDYKGWPLPRTAFADLIATTRAVSGITVLMPNPDIRNTGNDEVLALRMNYTPTVLASAASTQVTGTNPHVGTAQLGEDPLPWLYEQTAKEYLSNPIQAPFVIFGTTAEGVTNPVPTPAGAKYPHEIQANILHNLIQGTAPSSPTWASAAEYGIGLLALIILALATRSVWLSVPSLVLVVGGSSYGAWYAYQSSYLIDASGIVIICVLFWAYHSFLSFISEYRQKLRIKQQFGTYVSPDLVKKLQEDPSLLRLGGSTEQLTFLFSDIRGFTPISEKYQKNPQGLTVLINRFLDNQTKIILKHGGTIDKYMGDCIMAFWGAPLPDENHIQNATNAAIEMRIALEELNEKLAEEGLDQINTGAGINTGDCVVGNFGSSTRFDYSVLGDSVNLAARLESSCKEYDADLIISEYSLVDGYEYEFLDEVTVKGKSEPVKIYTIRK